MAEKAQRNIRLEAVEKARRQGLSGAEIVLRVKNGTGHKLKLEKASLTVYYAGGVVTKVALREPAEAPRRATASVTTLWRIRTSDPMALHVMTKKIREDDISKIGVSFAVEGRGGPARVKISREMMPLSEFLNIFGLSKQLFEENYPGIKVYMVYENPYFKVAVGDCLTTEEAIILKGRVSSAFPKAFVKNETLSIADLLN